MSLASGLVPEQVIYREGRAQFAGAYRLLKAR